MSLLQFTESPNPGKKTKRWIISSAMGGTVLGYIQFHPQWRKYVWSMFNSGIIFDVKCTQEVVDFLIQHAEDRNG